MLLSGASLTFAFAPFNAWPVIFPALAVAIIQLYKRPDKGFLTGWLFGLGWFGAGISWVHVSIADFGGMPLIASVGVMVLLCAYLALYPALAFWITKRIFTPALWPLSLPGCLVCYRVAAKLDAIRLSLAVAGVQSDRQPAGRLDTGYW